MIKRQGVRRSELLFACGRRLLASTRGATAIEYALVAGLIALVIIGAVGSVGDALRDLPLPALVAAFASASS